MSPAEPVMGVVPSDLKARVYWCFISYRHADNILAGRMWATWLHRELETFTIPASLVGSVNQRGEVIPERIFPVFRDEEELPANAELSSAIIAALERSLTLVALCSPRACESRFVHDEIRLFKAMGKGERLFGAIIAGNPASDGPDGCIPAPLKQAVAADGQMLVRPDANTLFDMRTENGAEGWTENRWHVKHLIALGVDPEEARAEVIYQRSRLEDTKIRLIAAILAVPAEQLIEANQSEGGAEQVRQRRSLGVWLVVACTVIGLVAWAISLGLQSKQDLDLVQSQRNANELLQSQAEQELRANEATLLKKRASVLYAEAGRLLKQDPVKALQGYRESAESGFAPAMVGLAELLCQPKPTKENEAEGLRWLEKAIALGHVPAYRVLGVYLLSQNRGETRPRGLELLQQGARAGDGGAEKALALALASLQPHASLPWLESCAAKGDAESLWQLALFYQEGLAASGKHEAFLPNVSKACELALRAAELGHAKAQFEVGSRLCDGRLGFTKNPVRGVQLLRSAIVNGHDATLATAQMKNAYADENNVPASPPEALDWHTAAAQFGFPKSMLALSRALQPENGPLRQIALSWCQKAAATDLPEAWRALGDLQMRGLKKDAAAVGDALASFYKGACLGDSDCLERLRQSALAGGQFNTPALAGKLLLAERKQEAREVLNWGVSMRDSAAALLLGDKLAENAASAADWTLALSAYRSGADFSGRAAATCLYRAAVLIGQGKGARLDSDASERGLRSAAEKGEPLAMLNYAQIIVKRSKPEGRAWLKLAAEHGAPEAAVWLSQFTTTLTATERTTSDDLYRQLMGTYPPLRLRPAPPVK